MPEFLNPAEAEFWVFIGLLIFFGIVAFVAKAPQKIGAALDGQAAAIQANLDEAARIREEAQRLLDTLKAELDSLLEEWGAATEALETLAGQGA